MIIGSQLFADSDNQGNKLFLRVFFNERKEKVSANIHLRLKGEERPRLLGNYYFHNKTFYCKRKMSKHYHYQVKGFGFNWKVLDDPYLAIERVHIVLDGDTHYEIPKTLLSQYGTFLNFKQQGFELQRFIRLDLIKLYSKIPDEPQNDHETETEPSNNTTNQE